ARGEALGVDAAGNVYLTGTFAGTIRYDPEDRDGNGDLGERTVQSGSASFLASYRSDGTLRFVLVLEGVSAHGLTTLRNGDSYLTGSFGGVVDFDPGSGVHELRGEGGRDVFVARYDSLGRFLGAFSLEGSGLDKGSGIAVDHEGNVLL